jgi:DNA-directed RNA polymerase subunit RPC12/RpoP
MADVSGVAEATDFPVSRCARCSRDVLTHVDLEDDGTERRRCLHCDAEIDPQEVRWVAEPELATLGYALQGDAPVGCGRPGCGMGRCGNN